MLGWGNLTVKRLTLRYHVGYGTENSIRRLFKMYNVLGDIMEVDKVRFIAINIRMDCVLLCFSIRSEIKRPLTLIQNVVSHFPTPGWGWLHSTLGCPSAGEGRIRRRRKGRMGPEHAMLCLRCDG
jgi:hypothetical protein